VVFKLLPNLLEQSKAIFQEQLGIPYEKKLFIFQFNLKTPLVVRERRNEGIKVHSVFKKMYHQLLATIVNKGCVLTDYKSFPLFQEKLIKLYREFVAMRAEGLGISDIEMEHRDYLRKIILLLNKREKCLMDEFDVPNRSNNRLQIPLGRPFAMPNYFQDITIELYEFIKNDGRLGLAQDQQRDLFKIYGYSVLLDLAEHLKSELAKNKSPEFQNAILRYLTGKDEDILDMLQDETDAYLFTFGIKQS
jgi:hypothetical protein